MAGRAGELRAKDVGERFGLPPWTVNRLFRRGLIPGAVRWPRGNWRVPVEALPAVRQSLVAHGYLPPEPAPQPQSQPITESQSP